MSRGVHIGFEAGDVHSSGNAAVVGSIKDKVNDKVWATRVYGLCQLCMSFLERPFLRHVHPDTLTNLIGYWGGIVIIILLHLLLGTLNVFLGKPVSFLNVLNNLGSMISI